MKKKITLTRTGKKFAASTFLFILDLIFVFNVPLILKEVNTINDYRYNWLILFVLFMSNAFVIYKIENN